MLTADLVRVTRRKGALKPTWVKSNDSDVLELAADIIGAYEAMLDARRVEVEEALTALIQPGRAGLLGRGLAKLVDDRATWDTKSAAPPVKVREAVFAAAARCHPVVPNPWSEQQTSRDEVLGEVAAELGLSVTEVEESLYADLRQEQRLLGLREITPERLIERYNLALPQALLLRARELQLEVAGATPGQLRQLFRHLKFFQLMHRARRGHDGSWSLVIDGPASVVLQTQRYGMQLANLLGTLPLLPRWSMVAAVEWGKDRRPGELHLDQRSPLRSPWRSTGTWQSAEEKLLLERLKEPVRGWRLERASEIIPLAHSDVLVPDLVLIHDKTGRRAWVEIVGFWRKAWLEARHRALLDHGPKNLVLCVSRRLATAKDAAGLDGMQVVEFAEVISVPRLIAAAEACAV